MKTVSNVIYMSGRLLGWLHSIAGLPVLAIDFRRYYLSIRIGVASNENP
jgi:hypothetical protein